jgi:hypothetical protein
MNAVSFDLQICVGRSVNPYFICTRADLLWGLALSGTVSGQEVMYFARCLVGMCDKVHVAPKCGDVIPVL